MPDIDIAEWQDHFDACHECGFCPDNVYVFDRDRAENRTVTMVGRPRDNGEFAGIPVGRHGARMFNIADII